HGGAQRPEQGGHRALLIGSVVRPRDGPADGGVGKCGARARAAFGPLPTLRRGFPGGFCAAGRKDTRSKPWLGGRKPWPEAFRPWLGGRKPWPEVFRPRLGGRKPWPEVSRP